MTRWPTGWYCDSLIYLSTFVPRYCIPWRGWLNSVHYFMSFLYCTWFRLHRRCNHRIIHYPSTDILNVDNDTDFRTIPFRFVQSMYVKEIRAYTLKTRYQRIRTSDRNWDSRETKDTVQSRNSTTTTCTLNSVLILFPHDILHCSFDICIFALHSWFNQACVGENETRRCSDEPEQSHEWRGEPQEGDANHEEPCVQGLLGDKLPIDFL